MARKHPAHKVKASKTLECGCTITKVFTVTAGNRMAFQDAKNRMAFIVGREAAKHTCPTPAAPATTEPTKEPTP